MHSAKTQAAREIIENAIAKLREIDPKVTVLLSMIPLDEDRTEPDCCFAGKPETLLVLAAALFVHALEAAGKKATMVDVESGQVMNVPSVKGAQVDEFDDWEIEEK